MSKNSLKTAIIGAAGYTGSELARLLFFHPAVADVVFISRSGGDPIINKIPSLRGHSNACFIALEDADLTNFDVVFCATPPAVAMNIAKAPLSSGAVVIDLSPDFRLRDTATYEHWYGVKHSAPNLIPQAVYGLSETARAKIATADLIACPGCFATAVELALIPFAAAGLIDGQVIIDAKSGISGAGRRTDRTDLLYAEQAENFKAYAIDGHRHQPEIAQAIADFGDGNAPPFVFIPHLLPTVRGIYVSCYIPLKETIDPKQIITKHWQEKMFLDILGESPPQLAHVVGTNKVQIGAWLLNNKTALVITALDNLIKGAAGQAVQNMNIRFAQPEATGLSGARPL